MTVTIAGVTHEISNDYATDTGQWWGFDGPVAPECPSCGVAWELYGDDFGVDALSPDVWHVRCLECEHEILIEGT